MPFPWLHVQPQASLEALSHKKALDMFRTEVRQRAALLMHLGYTQKQAATRCRQNIDWDFDLSRPSPVAGEVDGLVKEVFQRR